MTIQLSFGAIATSARKAYIKETVCARKDLLHPATENDLENALYLDTPVDRIGQDFVSRDSDVDILAYEKALRINGELKRTFHVFWLGTYLTPELALQGLAHRERYIRSKVEQADAEGMRLNGDYVILQPRAIPGIRPKECLDQAVLIYQPIERDEPPKPADDA